MVLTHVIRTTFGLSAVVISVLALSVTARANYNDVGPLSDVFAARTFVAAKLRVSIENVDQVVVDGDGARVGIGGKGYMRVTLHRTAGRWTYVNDASSPMPQHIKAFFSSVESETGTSQAVI